MRRTMGRFGPLIGALDQGTSSTRFLVFCAKTAEVLTFHQIPSEYTEVQNGWTEQDAMYALKLCIDAINQTVDNLRNLDIDPADVVAIGIANQRESAVIWDCKTGKPLYNVIMWMDFRTQEIVDEFLTKHRGEKNCFRSITGLPINPYFSAFKFKWLLENVPAVQESVQNGTCLCGTLDSWLIWNLTGGINGGIHVTDVTNASRTSLMNINSLKWDKYVCDRIGIPMQLLPVIRSSSEIYGYLTESSLKGIPISGCLGDQQAALVGQMCLKRGQAKCTLGSGGFLLYNTGTTVLHSSHGLITTVAYKLGKKNPVHYAVEGSIPAAGLALSWLKNNLNLVKDEDELGQLAKTVDSTNGVYFVPAFSGLYAPYWRKDAKSIICGVTETTKQAHIALATLESICFQIRDILEAIRFDIGIPLSKLLVDGGVTVSNILMQMQADLCNVSIIRPLMTETTALGAAMAAGNAEGVDVWDIASMQPMSVDVFKPSLSDNNIKYAQWKKAVSRCMDWSREPWDLEDLPHPHKLQESIDPADTIASSIPASIYLISSIAMLVLAESLSKT